jgi:hypothetical protein
MDPKRPRRQPALYARFLHRSPGFVRVAFRLAFWHLMHTSWRDAVVDVASRGGDADTNAAIAARCSARATAPRRSRRRLGVLAARSRARRVGGRHHPRHMLARDRIDRSDRARSRRRSDPVGNPSMAKL